MQKSVTQNQILQFIYGETDAATEILIQDALVKNPELLAYYQDAVGVKQELDRIAEEPNPTTLAIIGEFSHDSHTEAV